MSLLTNFLTSLDKCGAHVVDAFKKLQQYATQPNNFEALWATGCLTKLSGIVDACSTLETLIPIVKSETMDFENVVALSQASYTYLNLHSLLHDTLDNIGFMYGVKVMERSEHAYAKSFLDILNDKTGQLKTKSNDNLLNERLEQLFVLSKPFVERDNDYKHVFAPGLIHLMQPESFIRNFPLSGNIVAYLDKGAVKVDEAQQQVTVVREEILSSVIELILQIGNYKTGHVEP